MGRKKLVRKVESPSKRGIAWPRWTGFRGMTVRDWLDLLVVPLALVVISFLFTVQQDQRQQKIEDQRAQQAQKIENQRAEAERELAVQRAQDEALQAYLDQMSHLLLEKELRDAKEGSVVRTLARARTIAAMQRLDAQRNMTVVRFLGESKLIETDGTTVSLLKGASFDHADLAGADLSGADLSGADLRHADLSGAQLVDADLSGAYLRKAQLSGGAVLSGADLGRAKLQQADLSASDLINSDLSGADLSGANLIDAALDNAEIGDGAYLFNAKLRGADLHGADLRTARLNDAKGVTEEQLEDQTNLLKGATMPDGTIHH